MKFILPILSFGLVVTALVKTPTVSFTEIPDGLKLGGGGVGPTIRLDAKDSPGVIRAAGDLALDFERITGTKGTVITDGKADSNPAVIIVGTIGKSSLIDGLVASGKIDVSGIQGKWESFVSSLVENPIAGVSKALVIAGSDRRGAIFGIYDVSEQIGVSPWWWWADVTFKTKSAIYALPKTAVSGPPSIKYRGIFLNDEQPALTNWVNQFYPRASTGSPGFNANFHARVFELLLRLKANYFWPTMWDNMFYLDDTQNGPLAETYGIVMGTTHTEPLARSTKEQGKYCANWDWSRNQNNVKNFMREGVTRSKNWETLYTVGMRGHGDEASPTLNAKSLEDIITFQQSTLQSVLGQNDLSKIPQTWCLYKEVGNYLAAGMKVPDTITLLWSDDNVGSMTRLPTAAERNRVGGAGVYYHFDYVGSPRNYKWINSIQLSRTWEQMTLAYERNARNIWIVNVGDLKPLELPINHFLDMAYDITAFKSGSSTDEWLKTWAAREFGSAVATRTAEAMAVYGKLIIRRKYEQLNNMPYAHSVTNFDEALRVLDEWQALKNTTQSIYDSLDAATKPSFFEIVHHPAIAGHTVQEIYAKAALNQLYARQKRQSANRLATEVRAAFTRDQDITKQYHSLLGGKWNHMMDQIHLGYNNWQDPGSNTLPGLASVSGTDGNGLMGISVQGSDASLPGGTVPTMIPLSPYTGSWDRRYINLYVRGSGSYTYNIKSNVAYVIVNPSSGTLSNTDDIKSYITVDWSQAPKGSSTATFTITGASKTVTLSLPLSNVELPSSFTKGHVESAGYISLEAGHPFSLTPSSSGTTYTIIPNYGRTHSGLVLSSRTFPSLLTPSTAPKATYKFHTFTPPSSSPRITIYISMAFNTDPSQRLSYAYSLDGAAPTTVQPVSTTTLGTMPSGWDQACNQQAWVTTQNLNVQGGIKQGEHTLDFWALEGGVVLQKVVVDLGGKVAASYMGPGESAKVGF